MARNSSSALDLAITDYFLLRKVIRFPPTKVLYPEVNLRSKIDPAQFAYV
jgi:hypothetical protein